METEINALFGEDEVISETTKTLPQIKCLAEVKNVEWIGGQRGVFATTDIPAGVLVLSEVPIMNWPDTDFEDGSSLLEVIASVCMDADARNVTRILHPRSLHHADEDELKRLEEIISPEQLYDLESKLHVPSNEIKRIFLTLQHNGFASGLYEHLTMVNHSCKPNCIKFLPKTGSYGASEIWSVQPIAAGEEITISYCSREMTKKSMQKFLELHHRFHCQCADCKNTVMRGDNAFMETVKPAIVAFLCVSKLSDESKLEKSTEEEYMSYLQLQLDSIESELNWQALEESAESVSGLYEMMHSIMYLVREYVLSEFEALSVPVVSRMLRLLQSCAIAQMETSIKLGAEQAKDNDKLMESLRISVSSSLLLLACQQQCLGSDHPDLITTNLDLVRVIEMAGVLSLTACLITALCEVSKCVDVAGRKDWKEAQLKPKTLKPLIAAYYQRQGDRIKGLYMRSKRYPDSVKMKHAPGTVYWGNHLPF